MLHARIHEALTQCCFIVGPQSSTSAHIKTTLGESPVFAGHTIDPVQQDDQLTDFTIQMHVIHCAVLSPFSGSWNYALSSYKTSDNFTTLASK